MFESAPTLKPPCIPLSFLQACFRARAPQSFLSRLLTGELDAGAYSSGEGAIPLKEIAKFPFVVLSLDVAVAPADKIPRMVITDGNKAPIPGLEFSPTGDLLESQ